MKKLILMLMLFQWIFPFQNPELTVAGMDCEDCHGGGDWTTISLKGFSHQTTNFPLAGSHRIQNCSDCHQGNTVQEKHQFTLEENECASCHLDIHKNKLGNDCAQCHGNDSWQVTSRTFNHELTQFSLLGSHRLTRCQECHTETPMTNFDLTPTDCYDCHRMDYDQSTNPAHLEAQLDTDCEICHATQQSAWMPSTFVHNLATSFVLDGAHKTTTCVQCHSGGNYDLPLDCAGCHIESGLANSNALQSDYDHDTHQINASCENCHVGTNWAELIFDHVNFTSIDCRTCHIPEQINSINPPHADGNVSSDCEVCHSTTASWTISSFDHTASQTEYLLTGAHLSADCESCHVNEIFNNTPNDCWSCHEQEYSETGTSTFPDSPSHIEDQYSQNCEVCHSTSTWEGAEIDHALTNFPLNGAHATVDCAQCHGDGNYDLPLDCAGCHIEGAVASTNSSTSNYDHETHNINVNCENCHVDVNWTELIFDHINFTETICSECHTPEHENSTDPPHGNTNIGSDCVLCHTSATEWTIDPFPHSSEQTSFVLLGLHLTTDCSDCHIDQVMNNTPNTCQDGQCHLGDFDDATNPNHTTVGYTIEYCEECHNSLGWSPDIYAHNLNAPCATCHFVDYQNTTNPNHTTGQGFSETCENCHTSTDTWEGASFDHTDVTSGCADCHMDDFATEHDEGFPTECEQCHISTSDWEDVDFSHTSIVDGCVDCHMNDFYDEHSDGDPTDCETCHTTEDWDDVTFNHDADYFPIYSGEHEGEWSTCSAECHVNTDDYTVFSCGLNGVCHEHNQSDMDSEHDEESDYIYESSACYNCHPNGEKDDDDDDDDLLRKWLKPFKQKISNKRFE
ncbi:MAG: hypothetical protein HN462_03595 [Candidatus Marinimicrobia bacterium]|nr:hypothetical protein [Candidatus Neomarinimicrobiota bacterium]